MGYAFVEDEEDSISLVCIKVPTSVARTCCMCSGVEVSSLGVGAWSWGDRSGYWGYGKSYGKEENK